MRRWTKCPPFVGLARRSSLCILNQNTHTHTSLSAETSRHFQPLWSSAAAIRHPFTDRSILLMCVWGGQPAGGEPEQSPWQPATQWQVQRKYSRSIVPRRYANAEPGGSKAPEINLTPRWGCSGSFVTNLRKRLKFGPCRQQRSQSQGPNRTPPQEPVGVIVKLHSACVNEQHLCSCCPTLSGERRRRQV